MESGTDYIAESSASEDDTREAACKYPEQTNTETDDTRSESGDIERMQILRAVTPIWYT